MKKKYYWEIILILMFTLNTILVCTNQIKIVDDTVYHFIFQFRSEILDSYLIHITKLGNVITIIGIMIALLMILPKKEKILISTVTISTVIINNLFKYIIKRPRPNHIRLIKQGGYSYPSGHAMISIAVYGLLIYLIYHKNWNKWIKGFLIGILILLILSIGISRIYVGVHYPSDIIGGYLLAILIEIVIIKKENKYLGGILNDQDVCK